jgi:hypothetical protein
MCHGIAMVIYSRYTNNNNMKQLVGKTGAALLILWALGMITIVVLGASSDGPIDGPELINAWTFYGFILGVPTVAIAMMKWGGQK